mgnify:CR=1 FL=1
MIKKIVFILTAVAFTSSLLLYNQLHKPSENKNLVLSERREIPQPPITISARVGGYILNKLTGWTSPFAEVILTSQGLLRKTLADEKGFFAFFYIPVPSNLNEFCLISKDANGLSSFPVCLPPPAENMDLEMENLILSPTLSLENGLIPVGKTVKASGMTLPEINVEVSLFTENQSPLLSFVPSALAFGLPKYQIKTNKNGYFEFSLPAVSPSKNRVFVIAKPSFNDLNLNEIVSPKSNTLTFQALGIIGLLKMLLNNFLKQIIAFLSNKENLNAKIIVFEIFIFLSLVFLFLFKKQKRKKVINRRS